MDAQIIDRGRGPELKGTRITVYRLMDFLREGRPAEEIAEQLKLTAEQVGVALTYIDEHRSEVELEYEKILERIRRGNPPEVERENAKTLAELRQRILGRRAAQKIHASRG